MAIEIPLKAGVGPFERGADSFSERPTTQPLNPANLIRAFGHRWKSVLFVGLLAASIGFAVDFSIPPPQVMYSTHALIRVEPAETLPGARSDARDLRTQSEMVKTRFVLASALEQGPAAQLASVRLDPAAALKRLTSDLKVEAVGPQILRVSLAGADPDELPILVNAVKDAYLREVVGNEQVRRLRRKEFLETALRDCEKRLSEKRWEISEVKAKAGGPGSDDRMTFDRFAALQKELFRIEMDVHRSGLELALNGRDKPDEEIAPAVVDGLAEKDPLVGQYRVLIAQHEDRIAHWEKVAVNPKDHERYRLYMSDRDGLIEASDMRKRDLARRFADSAAAVRQKKADLIQDRAARLAEDEKLFSSLVERGWDALKSRSKSEPELTLTRFEVERLEAIAKQLLDELSGLRLENNALARTGSLQDAAEPVEKRSSHKLMRTGLALLIPFLLAGGFITVWEARSRRIITPDDVRRATNARVLGVLPRLRSRQGTTVDWPSSLTDSVDALNATLLRDLATGTGRVLMITSAVPREGKSNLARHLATRMAATGKKTLLIDADLYRSTAHAAFGLPVGPGLSEALSGTSACVAACRATATEGVWVLTAGEASPLAFREMARGTFSDILSELRTAFDLIVIDTSPVLATTQPLLIGRHADAVVLSTLSAFSRSVLMTEAIHRLADLGIPVAGVVLNGAAEASRYGYYFQDGRRNALAAPLVSCNQTPRTG